MPQLTRRQFLQVSGIVLIGHSLAEAARFPLPNGRSARGRALAPLTITRADGNAARMALPDSLVTILDADDEHYRVASGFVPRTLVQPLTVPRSDAPVPALPFLAEVCAPVAPLRQACAADAPLVARVGHAGTAAVTSIMPDGRGGSDWYQVDAGNVSGWTQSTFWTPVHDLAMPGETPTRAVEIDRQTQTLTAFDGGEPVLQALVSLDPNADAGHFHVAGHAPTGTIYDGLTRYAGVPWLIALDGGGQLNGVYWHNHFGAPTTGPGIQLPPPVARWLFGWLGDGGKVTIR